MFFLRSLRIMSFGVGPNADRRANPLNYLREEGSNFGADFRFRHLRRHLFERE